MGGAAATRLCRPPSQSRQRLGRIDVHQHRVRAEVDLAHLLGVLGHEAARATSPSSASISRFNSAGHSTGLPRWPRKSAPTIGYRQPQAMAVSSHQVRPRCAASPSSTSAPVHSLGTADAGSARCQSRRGVRGCLRTRHRAPPAARTVASGWWPVTTSTGRAWLASAASTATRTTAAVRTRPAVCWPLPCAWSARRPARWRRCACAQASVRLSARGNDLPIHDLGSHQVEVPATGVLEIGNIGR